MTAVINFIKGLFKPRPVTNDNLILNLYQEMKMGNLQPCSSVYGAQVRLKKSNNKIITVHLISVNRGYCCFDISNDGSCVTGITTSYKKTFSVYEKMLEACLLTSEE